MFAVLGEFEPDFAGGGLVGSAACCRSATDGSARHAGLVAVKIQVSECVLTYLCPGSAPCT